MLPLRFRLASQEGLKGAHAPAPRGPSRAIPTTDDRADLEVERHGSLEHGGLQELSLRAIELVLEQVAGEFDGEGPALSREREALDDGKERLEARHLAAQTYVGVFKLPGPDEEEMELVREAIRQEGER